MTKVEVASDKGLSVGNLIFELIFIENNLSQI